MAEPTSCCAVPGGYCARVDALFNLPGIHVTDVDWRAESADGGGEQLDWCPERGDVMQPPDPSTMARRHDPAGRAPHRPRTGFDGQHELGRVDHLFVAEFGHASSPSSHLAVQPASTLPACRLPAILAGACDIP